MSSGADKHEFAEDGRTVEWSSLKAEFDGPIGWLVFNRPEKLNALDWRACRPGEEFSQALDLLEATGDVKVIVLKGVGLPFCVGGDFSGDHGGLDLSRVEDMAWIEALTEQALRLRRSPKPTIAQIQGYCIASGLIFASGCDLMFAAEDARLGVTPVRASGLPPDLGRWPLLIGIRRMKELLFTGDTMTGREAANLGVVNGAVPLAELEPYVAWLARRISLIDSDLLGLYKRAPNDAADAAGLRETIALGSTYQALAHWTPKRGEFRDRVETDGPKGAYSARDDAFGGSTPRSILWEREAAKYR
jgi:enoyl-CoA hydratase